MTNRYSQFALLSAILAILLFYITPSYPIIFIASLLLAFVAIALGIKGFSDFKKDKSIGGEGSAIVAIIIGVGYFLFLAVGILLTSGPPAHVESTISKCKNAAVTCASNIATGVYSNYTQCQLPCITYCTDATTGYDAINQSVLVTPASCVRGQANGCAYCAEGNISLIYR